MAVSLTLLVYRPRQICSNCSLYYRTKTVQLKDKFIKLLWESHNQTIDSVRTDGINSTFTG